jgi:hypothetical protein
LDKKQSFWILLILFGLLTLSGLVINQVNGESTMQDMGLSMGGMMKMHAAGLEPSTLLKFGFESHGMDNFMDGHHELPPLIASLSFLTTITVFIFVPLLIGGAVLVLILWL